MDIDRTSRESWKCSSKNACALTRGAEGRTDTRISDYRHRPSWLFELNAAITAKGKPLSETVTTYPGRKKKLDPCPD